MLLIESAFKVAIAGIDVEICLIKRVKLDNFPIRHISDEDVLPDPHIVDHLERKHLLQPRLCLRDTIVAVDVQCRTVNIGATL